MDIRIRKLVLKATWRQRSGRHIADREDVVATHFCGQRARLEDKPRVHQ